jgi:IclR family transcriptional regulator, pca regulon regulatory protein
MTRIANPGDEPPDNDDVGESETVASVPSLEQLERGLAVLQSFSREHPALTVSDVSRLTGVNRASARRILLTLRNLGYVRSEDRYFSLTPGVLKLGWSYFASLGLDEFARPVMRELTKQVDEACSLATLDLPDIVYVAREYGQHHMTVSGSVGSRIPAHATAIGCSLLAYMREAEIDAYLEHHRLQVFTPHTVTDPAAFKVKLRAITVRGWALVDQELEIGLRAVAAPVFGAQRRPVAALSVSSNSARTSLADLQSRCLPRLLEAAESISMALRHGAGRSVGF